MFCIPGDAVEEVLPVSELVRPPNCPEMLEGLLVLGRRSHPVVNLSRLFGLAVTPVEKFTPLVVLKEQYASLALRVDHVLSIFDSTNCPITGIAETESFNGCCVGVLEHQGECLHLLAPDKLLARRESRLLSEFHQIAEHRVSQFNG